MTRRYYSSEPIVGASVTLDGAEAHHLLHVLRAGQGMGVVLFDGSGQEFDAEVTACGRSTVELAVCAGREVDRELPAPLVLGVPLPKGDRQRWIVEKAVELGVTTLVPLATARAIAGGGRRGDKLERYVIEASKQCGRNRLMEIGDSLSWDEWIIAPTPRNARRLIADPAGTPITEFDRLEPRATFACVGPEGGLSDEELAAAQEAGWELIALGPRILRIETAALALAALVGGR